MSGTDYFVYTALQAGTLARAGDINSRLASIQSAFGLFPHYLKLQQGRATYVQDTGATNALVVALDFAPATYVAGLEFTVKAANSNSGPATMNVNGLGAITIKRADGSDLLANDIVGGRVVHMIFDGTYFQILGASEAAAAASSTAAALSSTQAGTYATAASVSATAAAASATAAATSATNAASSATAAAAAVSGYLPKAGGTMTGALVLSGAPTLPLHAATKAYIDSVVVAAGSFTADGTTITLSTGQFSLTTIANNTLLGNVSGGTAKPGAITGAQLTPLLTLFSASAQGVVGSPGASNGRVLKDDGSWTTSIIGNAATATALATPRTIAISGAVTGTATAFDGTGNITIPINAMDVSQATAGILPVARGGTGVATATGTGSTVLNISPSFGGTANFASAIYSGLAQNQGGTTNYGFSHFRAGQVGYHLYNGGAVAEWLVYQPAHATGDDFRIATLISGSISDRLTISTTGIVTLAAVPAAGSNNAQAVSSAWVQGELTNYAKAFLPIISASGDYTLVTAHDNQLHQLTGTTAHIITADGTPTAGTSVLLLNISSATWTFSCAGGVYLAGSSTTVTTVSLAAGTQATAIHLGSGVWALSGV